MAKSLRPVTVAPKGMGLNDFVAHQEGFFAAEGLDVEFDWKTFRGTQSSWKGLDYFQRPQDQPYTQDKQDVIQGACVWGTHLQRQRRHGPVGARRLWRFAVGDLRASGLADPPAGGPQGRAGLGRHARRQPFQRAVPAGEISAAREHQGGEHRRLRRAAEGAARRRGRGREPAAAADRDGRAARLAQDHRGHASRRCGGCRSSVEPEDVRAYLRALDRAEKAMDADLDEIPAAMEARGAVRIRELPPVGLHASSAAASGSSTERCRARNSTRRWRRSKRWGLDQYLKERSFENLTYSAAP